MTAYASSGLFPCFFPNIVYSAITPCVKQEFETVKTAIYDSMKAHTDSGTFDIEGMSKPDPGVPTVTAECPVGTKSSAANTFSCGEYKCASLDMYE